MGLRPDRGRFCAAVRARVSIRGGFRAIRHSILTPGFDAGKCSKLRCEDACDALTATTAHSHMRSNEIHRSRLLTTFWCQSYAEAGDLDSPANLKRRRLAAEIWKTLWAAPARLHCDRLTVLLGRCLAAGHSDAVNLY